MKPCLVFLLTLGISLADDNGKESFDLDDSYMSAHFKGYRTATFTLTSDAAVDFWVTDSDGYNDWRNDKTPPTARMFTSTYCSDCTAYSTIFTPPSINEKYYYVVSALNPSTDASGTLEFYYDGSGDYSSGEEEDDNTGCFSEEALVHFRNGSSLPLKNARVGDEILAASYSGEVSFSPVIHTPHKQNDERGRMIRITTRLNTTIVMTRNHLVMTCEATEDGECSLCMSSNAAANGMTSNVLDLLSDPTPQLSPFSLKRAEEVSTSTTCVLTSSSTNDVQWTRVLAVSSSAAASDHNTGLYSIVTRAPYPIVNGIVASPFATSHVFGHMFYHMHRIAYALGLSENPTVASTLVAITEIMQHIVNLPQVKIISKLLMDGSLSITAAFL